MSDPRDADCGPDGFYTEGDSKFVKNLLAEGYDRKMIEIILASGPDVAKAFTSKPPRRAASLRYDVEAVADPEARESGGDEGEKSEVQESDSQPRTLDITDRGTTLADFLENNKVEGLGRVTVSRVLLRLDGLTNAEIAKKTKSSLRTVTVTLNAAEKVLHAIFGDSPNKLEARMFIPSGKGPDAKT